MKEKILTKAAELFSLQGYTATGINQIIQEAGIPKGSLYHYFPEGKEQIAEQAIVYFGGVLKQATIDLFAQHSTALAAMQAYIEMVIDYFQQAGLSASLPLVMAVSKTSYDVERIQIATKQVMQNWMEVCQNKLQQDHYSAAEAEQLTTLLVMLLEGAVVMALIHKNLDPLRTLSTHIPQLFVK